MMLEQQPVACQTSLAAKYVLRGVGVHSGRPAAITLFPAPANTGIVFRRTDLPNQPEIAAKWDKVSQTALCTVLQEGEASVSTVEHLLAALAGCGVDNALIEVDGSEIPIMDGSAAPFVEAIAQVGVVSLAEPLHIIRILTPVTVVVEDKTATLSPSERFVIDFKIQFEDTAIGTQQHRVQMTGDAFVNQFAFARTFGRFKDVEQLRKMGFARGGSLQNAIVVDEGCILNKGGLRCTDEFVRHKILDAVGDLCLAGMPIVGAYHGVKAGHDLTNRLLHVLFSMPNAWQIETISDRSVFLPMIEKTQWGGTAARQIA